MTIHSLCGLVHALTERTEVDIKFYLDRIAMHNKGGFSPETLVAIQMGNDVKTLRALADRIAGEREKLVARERRAA